MQKTVKTGFRGERKGNPLPVHILSYSETSPKERGNVVTEKRGMWWQKREVMMNKREVNDEERVTKKGECSDGKMNLQGEISNIGKVSLKKLPYLCPRNSNHTL